MSIFAMGNKVPENCIIAMINSSFISHYVDDYVNNTQTFQINDARQLPIIVPTSEQINCFDKIVNFAIQQKKWHNEYDWKSFQKQLDNCVYKLYGLD